MITIKGKQVSEDTAHLALQEYFKAHPEKYHLQAGDVAKCNGGLRIIVEHSGVLLSFNEFGGHENHEANFETNGYKKIGELKDYIK